MPVIVIQNPNGESKIQLEVPVVTMGRSPDNDVPINDVRASRKHCELVQSGETYKVVDLGSGNGTKVNGVKIKEQTLKSGDLIQIGSVTILFADGHAPTGSVPPRVQQVGTQFAGNPFGATQIMTSASPTAEAFEPLDAPDPLMVDPVPAPSVPAPSVRPVTSRSPTGRTTSRAGRISSRTSMGGPHKGMTSRTSRMIKKKFWTPGKILLTVGLVFVGGILYLFVGSMNAPSPEFDFEKARGLHEEATSAANKGDFKKSMDILKKLKAFIEGKEHLVKKYELITKEAMASAEANIVVQNKAPGKYRELLTRFENIILSDSVGLNDLKKEVQKAKQEFSLTQYLEKFKELERKINNAINNAPKESDDKVADLNGRFSGDLKEGRYSQLMKEWSDFKRNLGSADLDKVNVAENRLNEIHATALDEVTSRLKAKAEEKFKGESKEAAVRFLEGEKPRFEGTSGAAALDELISEFKIR